MFIVYKFISFIRTLSFPKAKYRRISRRARGFHRYAFTSMLVICVWQVLYIFICINCFLIFFLGRRRLLQSSVWILLRVPVRATHALFEEIRKFNVHMSHVLAFVRVLCVRACTMCVRACVRAHVYVCACVLCTCLRACVRRSITYMLACNMCVLAFVRTYAWVSCYCIFFK